MLAQLQMRTERCLQSNPPTLSIRLNSGGGGGKSFTIQCLLVAPRTCRRATTCGSWSMIFTPQDLARPISVASRCSKAWQSCSSPPSSLLNQPLRIKTLTCLCCQRDC